MKHISLITILAIGTLAASAAVPLHWTVESSRTSLAQLEAYHGETLDIAATMQTYGKPLSLDGKTAVLYYQTNGMEQAWWSVNGTCSGSTARVTFTPAMDPGASILNLFLSVQDGGNNYRAHARLKMLGSPGADAHVIEPPIVTLDFSRIGIVLNAPYYTKAEADGLLDGKADKTNTYTKAETEQKIQELAPTPVETDPVYTADKEDLICLIGDKADKTNTYTKAEVDAAHAGKLDRIVRDSQFLYNHSEFRQTLDGLEYIEYQTEDGQTEVIRRASLGGEMVYVTEDANWLTAGIHANEDYRGFGISQSSSDFKNGYFSTFYGDGFIDFGENEITIPNATGTMALKSTTLAGYGINNAYTKAEVDGLVEDAGKVKTVAGQEPDASGNVSLSPSTIGAASSEDVQTLNLGYQRLYSFSTGATNANISVTNYPPTAAEAEGRTHYDPNDPDLDFSTVPASIRLDEKRDGEKRTVVDTRDWPVWYFGCKLPRILAAAQEYAHTAYTNALAHLSAWADRTARGLENPAGESTLVIDVPNIWLMTDQTFEKHVSGSSSCWVIRSKNAAISPNVTTNGFLELTDAFGTPYIRFNKTEATFADPPASGIYHDDQEGEWIITYETTTKPKGGANLALQGSETYPGKAILKEEGDELCPAVITWTGSSGHWLMHAKPKQIAGADPGKMFFGAVVEVEGQDYIEYLKPVSFSHLVMPNGKKIAPDVPASASVGTVVNWKVVQ